MDIITQKLIDAWSILVRAGDKGIEEVPEELRDKVRGVIEVGL